MKVLFHIPSVETVYAMRSIYHGFKNAFNHSGDVFKTLDQNVKFERILNEFKPDLFITSSHYWYRKQIDFKILNIFRKKGMFVLVKVDFWNSPFSKFKINEAKALKDDYDLINLIKRDNFGDAYYHNVEQNDPRMAGFYKGTGRNFYTIPLACDSFMFNGLKKNNKYASDICFIGTNLNSKKIFFKKNLKKLRKYYNTKVIGQDWTTKDQILGHLQKFGQYYNIKYMKTLRKPKLQLIEEGMYYFNSKICLNVHEDYQLNYGGDCNERTFKIPFCSGFQLVDKVKCIEKYFDNQELTFYENDDDLFEKINFFLNQTDKRLKMIEKAKKKIIQHHTYLNRVKFIKDVVMR